MPLFSRYPVVRAWSEFFEFSKFAAPKNPQTRLAVNLSYYAGNYMIIFAFLFASACMTNLMLLFGLLLVLFLGLVLKEFLKQRNAKATTLSKTAKKKHQKKNKQIAQYGIYALIFLLFLFGSIPLSNCIVATLGIVIGHGLFRTRNIKSNAVHFMDVYKDFGPISSLAEWVVEWAEGQEQ
eukprot:1018397_1